MLTLQSVLYGYAMVCVFFLSGNWMLAFTVRAHKRVSWPVILLLTLLQALAILWSQRLFWAGNIVVLFLFFPVFYRVIDIEPYKLLYLSVVTVTHAVICNLVFFVLFGCAYTWGWDEMVWVILGFALTMPAMVALMGRVIWPRLSRLSLPNPRWLSVVPVFIITIEMLISSSYVQDLMTGYEWVYSLTAIIVALSSMGVSLLILVMMEKMQDAANYQKDLHMIDLYIASQGRRYEDILQFINDIRVMRHDMRHQVSVATMLLNDGKLDTLRDFLHSMAQDNRLHDQIIYSQNCISDLIAHHTLYVARDADIRVSIRCGLPEVFWVSDTDLCVLLGNLTENALNACRLQKEGPRDILLSATVRKDEAVIRVENSCGNAQQDTTARRKALGLPQSKGYGMLSVRTVAAKYNGVATFEPFAGRFCASVLLYRPEAESPGGIQTPTENGARAPGIHKDGWAPMG